jgi:hypothetical protein
MQWHKIFLVAFLALILSACGEGLATSTEAAADGAITDTSSVILTTRLLDCPTGWNKDVTQCTDTTQISIINSGVVAVSLSQDGVALRSQIITSTVSKGALQPDSALTNSSGVAFFTLISNNDKGAGRITLTTDAAEQTTSDTLNFEIGASNLEMSIENDTAGTVLAQNSTALITVNLTVDAVSYHSPVEVTFSSSCADDDATNLDESIMTTNGVAEAKYQPASTCVGENLITASIEIDNLFATTAVTLDSFPAQSINYLGASPEWIALQGTGGAGREETSILTFQVVNKDDSVSAGREVEFTLSGPSGSVINQSSATTDENGEVTVYVSSGKVSGVVRVRAKLVGSDPLISSVSDQLVISTGLPDQDSFTLGLSDFAPSAWNHNGEIVTVTVILADHWNNSVPDGTAVFFQTEGGKIQNSGNPTGFCLTVQGTCSVKWESTNPRPDDGLVTITAWALGEESFADKDGDGWFTDGDIFTISSAVDFNEKTDLGEVFFDYNNNNVYDEEYNNKKPEDGLSYEEFVVFDINTNPDDQKYTNADKMFTGILCSDDQASLDKCAKSLVHVRMNTTLAMVSDEVSCKLYNGDTEVTNTSYDLSSDGAVDLTVVVEDINGNTPPTGTTINIETLNGQLNGTTSFTTSSSDINAPVYQFTLANEDPLDDVTEGLLTVKMVTPKYSEVFTCKMTVIDAAAP